MKRFFLRWAGLVVSGVLLAGCAQAVGQVEWYRPQFGPVGEPHRPRLEAAWAQTDIAYGYHWRVYLKATDPDGDIDKVWISFPRYGSVAYAIVKATARRRANGYVETWLPLHGRDASEEDMEVRVEDRAGNLSAPKMIMFNLYIFRTPDTEVPPAFKRENKVGYFRFPVEVVIEEGDEDEGRE